MKKAVKSYFNRAVKAYHAKVKKILIRYPEMLWIAAEEIPRRAKNILDLGAGGGNFTTEVIKRFPKAKITLFDFSKEMLDYARKRFRGKRNIHYVEGDLLKLDLGEKYDAAVSSMAIHHLSTKEKGKLFRRIYAILNKGGIFVNADYVRGETKSRDRDYDRHWIGHLKAQGLSRKAWRSVVRRHHHHDLPDRLSVQLDLLKRAGFKHVDCIWKIGHQAVFGGRK
ncbi:MAG: methyltransferase domain-containing protein [Candidatus Omnitrophica bacterium]|nr:methyltransferase domain-containing protein [Candidatus Omnitrophota bacterium]